MFISVLDVDSTVLSVFLLAGLNFRFCTCNFKEDIDVHKTSKQLGGKIVNEPYILCKIQFPGFKHASQDNYFTYRLYIFTRS